MKIHYATNPIKIGKHEWRCLVIDANIFGTIKRCTRYQFRKPNEAWKNSTDWPSYNHNDTHNGLPKPLSQLYERNDPQIKAYLDNLVMF